MTDIGYQWLSSTYGVSPVHPLAVQSKIGRSRATTTLKDGTRVEVYPEVYRPDPTFAGHLTFAFRYEGAHLEFLARLYRQKGVREALEEWIHNEPTGAYARRAGFLYEWLMPEEPLALVVAGGNYVDALEPDQYVVGKASNNMRWRVRDNLPGTRAFCPVIRRTDEVRQAEAYDIQAKLAALEADYGADLILRSAVWLTVKESRSSFLIEQEQDQEDRIRRFAAVMERECGKHADPFALETLLTLQRGILGEGALRYGCRESPIYVGHNVRFQPVVDYVAPHWNDTMPMMEGLSRFLDATHGGSTLVRAAVASFGFVYIHPMADGNGRISRFLINDVLRRDEVVPAPIILPVSATITNSTRNRADYDQVLERFSKPLMHLYGDRYHFGETVVASNGLEYNFHFDAYDDALPAWRYPDLTAHVGYLANVIDQTLTHEMRDEARFLQANEQARGAIKLKFEAPNIDLDAIIRSVRENHRITGKLAKTYPLLASNPALAEYIVRTVEESFAPDNAVLLTSTKEDVDAMQQRLAALPALEERAGIAYTFWQFAQEALRAAPSPEKVKWPDVERRAIVESMGQHGQSPDEVGAVISQVSPGAVSDTQQQSILEDIKRLAPGLQAQYDLARKTRRNEPEDE